MLIKEKSDPLHITTRMENLLPGIFSLILTNSQFDELSGSDVHCLPLTMTYYLWLLTQSRRVTGFFLNLRIMFLFVLIGLSLNSFLFQLE